MSRTAQRLTSTLTIGLTLGLLTSTLAQQQTLWYRGYFDGEVAIRSGRNAGAYYRPSRPTTYPLHEAERYSDYLPCDRCGYYHRPGQYVKPLRRVCRGNGTHLDPDLVYTRAPEMLPGQYYYKKQNHYNFRTPITVGWPYMKYDQRTEATGTLRMGRTLDRRWRRR